MSSPTPETTHRHGFVVRHWIASLITVVIAAPIVVFALWATITLHYTYSTGQRAGYLLKVAKKGWLCKTWEGELQLVAIPGTAPEKFSFTTRSDSVAALLNKYNGNHVVVDYKQHKGVPTSCFGDTEYFVAGVRPVNGR